MRHGGGIVYRREILGMGKGGDVELRKVLAEMGIISQHALNQGHIYEDWDIKYLEQRLTGIMDYLGIEEKSGDPAISMVKKE